MDSLECSALVPGTPPYPDSSNLFLNPISNYTCTPIFSSLEHRVAFSIPSLSYTIAQAPPSISPSIPHTFVHQSSCNTSLCSDSSSSKNSYYLRSATTSQPLNALGIGLGFENIPSKNRGRPSHLEKVIKIANLEVKAGTQSTLMRVLRARRPNNGVP